MHGALYWFELQSWSFTPFYEIWLYWETIVPQGLLSPRQTMTNDLILGLAFEAEVY
jgi:hypothetical protein